MCEAAARNVYNIKCVTLCIRPLRAYAAFSDKLEAQYAIQWFDTTVSGLPEGVLPWPEVKAENGMPQLVIGYF
jgi:hypothetical protein